MYLILEAKFGNVTLFLLDFECLLFTENTRKKLSVSDLLRGYKIITLVPTSTLGGFR